MNDQRQLPIQYSRYKLLYVNFMQVPPVGNISIADCCKFPREVIFAQILVKFTYDLYSNFCAFVYFVTSVASLSFFCRSPS